MLMKFYNVEVLFRIIVISYFKCKVRNVVFEDDIPSVRLIYHIIYHLI